MKKLINIFLICSVSCSSQSKNNIHWPADKQEPQSTGITMPALLTVQQQKNLAVLCRVWGFVKYFHPRVAGGEVNVDKALFMIMPDVLKAPDDKTFGELLYNWINELGDIPVVSPKPLLPNVFIEPIFRWLQKDSLLTGNLRMKLQQIFENRHRGNGYYVSKLKTVGNPDFSNEFAYKNAKGEDGGMRMLGLFRYWNAVEYFFPSKYLTADNWDMVLQRFIPLFASCKTDIAYRMTCYQLVATIHDTHAANISNDPLIQQYLGPYAIPAFFEIVEDQMTLMFFYSDSLQASSGLLPGDQVISVNGQDIKKMIDSIKPYVAASNTSSFMFIAMNRLRRSDHIKNKLTIIRNGKTLDLTESYAPVNIPLKELRGYAFHPMYQKIGEDIGYINLGKIKTDSLPAIFRQLQNTKGLVIDIRSYPSEFMPFALGKYLKPAPSAFVKFTAPDLDLPGRFIMGEPVVNGENNPGSYKGKIVILVNAQTQSQAEYTAMALRTAPGAVVMGSQTSGADGNVSSIFFLEEWLPI